jgi:DNA polymerase elongation subunit (family B)
LSPYECNVPYVMRYMIDHDITGASWLTLPKGSYGLRKEEGEKGTWCQVSFLQLCVAYLELIHSLLTSFSAT